VFKVHEKSKLLCELTADEVKDINNGTKVIPQMNATYFEKDSCYGAPSDYFGFKDVKELTFEFIESEIHKITLLAEDLEAIARKNGMDNHELDPYHDKKTKEVL